MPSKSAPKSISKSEAPDSNPFNASGTSPTLIDTWPSTLDVPMIRKYTGWAYAFIETLLREKTIPSRYFGRTRMARRRDIDAYIDSVFATDQETPSWVAASIERERVKKLEKAA